MTPATTAVQSPGEVADAAIRLAGHALAFGRIDRTACRHPDGTPESDADHTVMLGWLAPALAALTEPGLSPDLVAAFCLVHDAVEVFAGDTPTLVISDQERAAKAAREHAAADRWQAELGDTLPWLPSTIARYEAQDCPEARFTRAADKICPKLLHVLSGATDLAAYGMTYSALGQVLARQRADVARYAGEFTGLLALYDEMATRTLAAMAATTGGVICPGCRGLAWTCLFCRQEQDPSCGHGVEHTPPGDGFPGFWRCSECRAVTANDDSGSGR
ncbi:MAG TPA: HD domain-containing protein [Trebonia sp.]|nr:HD domain-containing protein [Trebonia sp.]